MIGTSASSMPEKGTPVATVPASGELAPEVTMKPSAMMIARAPAFSPASAFCTMRPGPRPRMWMNARTAIGTSATIARRETISGTSGNGRVMIGVVSAAAGTNRPI